MISPRCFEESWIREQATALRARDLRTLEKNILAMELVSRLRREGLEFIFKGGTSLALFFDPVGRLSIDVDILSQEPIERLKAVLDQATTDRPPFAGYEHQERRDREAPPTVHFKIPYTSALDPGGVHSIQLDVITAESPYAATEEKVVRATFFEIEEEIKVTVPTADCLLADKLGCFALRVDPPGTKRLRSSSISGRRHQSRRSPQRQSRRHLDEPEPAQANRPQSLRVLARCTGDENEMNSHWISTRRIMNPSETPPPAGQSGHSQTETESQKDFSLGFWAREPNNNHIINDLCQSKT
jgi:hypothetical protein